MTSQILLERFDHSAHLAGDSRDFSDPSRTSERDANDPAAPGSEHEGDADQEQDAAELAAADLQDACRELQNVIQAIERDRAEAIRSAMREAADQVGRAVGTMFPHLIDEFGTAELAANVVAILEKADIAGSELLVAPEDHDALVAQLSDLASPIEVKVRPSQRQAQGTARLVWTAGGAELDVTAFLASARDVLRAEPMLAQDGDRPT